MTLGEVAAILSAELATGVDSLGIEVRSVCASDLMSDVLLRGRSHTLLLTGLTNPQSVRAAELADIQAICYVLGKPPRQESVELARRNGIPLLITPCSMYSACCRLHAAGLEGGDG